MDNITEREKKLWDLAQKRADFKVHFFVYVVVNLFLVLLWFWLGKKDNGFHFFWPVFSIAGWGLGVVFNYWGVYHDKGSMAEREFEKLKKERGLD